MTTTNPCASKEGYPTGRANEVTSLKVSCVFFVKTEMTGIYLITCYLAKWNNISST